MTNISLLRAVATGETFAATTTAFKSHNLPERRISRLRMLTELTDQTHTTNVLQAFAHSSPPAILHPGPAEVTEWMVFSFEQARRRFAGTPMVEGWRELARRSPTPRARIGTRAALINLASGGEPGTSGHDNVHYFDDLAMGRAVGVVAAGGSRQEIAAGVREDSEITNGLDGVWCALATAELLTALIAGQPPLDAVSQARRVLPAETWSSRIADESLAIAASSSGPLDLAQRLSREVGDWIYSYQTSAPETLGFLLAHVATSKGPHDIALGALAQPRNASTLPSLAFAAATAAYGDNWLPLEPSDRPLDGLALPEYAGRNIADIVA